jgi:hypothetical protein
LKGQEMIKHTIILLIIDQLVRCDHVHQADDFAVLMVLGGLGTSKSGDGLHAAVETLCLLQTDGRAGDLQVAVAKRDVVQALDDGIDNLVVGVLAEGNAAVLVGAGILD